MEDKILNLLLNSNNYISGEKISESLNVSRTAIWKHIKNLKSKGYIIEGISKKGYRLISKPDIIDKNSLNQYLTTKTIGRNIIHFHTINSTNIKAKELADNNSENGTVVISEEQIGGSGRLGRKWISPKGGSWSTIILKPSIPPVEAPKITQIAAAAVYKALEELGIKTTIKWPNDIHLNGKKLCGILTEMKGEMDSISYVVVGTGININIDGSTWNEEVKNTATSLKLEFKKDFNRAEITAKYLNHFEELYENFIKNLDLKATIDICRKNSNVFGKRAKLITYNKEEIVTCTGLTDTGNLIVRDSNGLEKIIFSGEITFHNID